MHGRYQYGFSSACDAVVAANGVAAAWESLTPTERRRIYYALLLSLPVVLVGLVLVVVWQQFQPQSAVPAVAVPTGDAAVPVADRTDAAPAASEPGPPLAGLVEQSRDLARRGMQAVVPSWTDEQPLTFLILGVDRRQQEIPRSDAIIVVNIDPVERRATLISVPRDLYVDIAGYGVMRINQTFVRGGAQLTRRTVEAVLGLPVDYFVKIEFDGFERIIDTLGGVEVELAQPLYDPYYPDDADGFKPLRIPAGRQRLNGEQALGFARSRLTDPEADFGRSKRQQQLLMALRDQLLTTDILPRLPALAQQLSDAVTTDFPLTKVPAFARLGMSIPEDRITRVAINYDQGMVASAITATGAEVLIPDLPRIRQVVHQAVNGSTATAAAGAAPSATPG